MTSGTVVLVTVDITNEIKRQAVVLAVGKHTLEVRYENGERDVVNRLNVKAVAS